MQILPSAPCPCGRPQPYADCCLASDRALAPSCAPLRPGEPPCPPRAVSLDTRLAYRIAAWAETQPRLQFNVFRDYPGAESCGDCVEAFATAWAVYHPRVDGRPVVAHYLDAHPDLLSAAEVRWLMLQTLSWASIWRVDTVGPHTVLTDVITHAQCGPLPHWDRGWAPAGTYVLARAARTSQGCELGAVHPVLADEGAADCVLDDLWCHPDLECGPPEPDQLRQPEWVAHLIALWEAPIVGGSMLTAGMQEMEFEEIDGLGNAGDDDAPPVARTIGA